MLLRVVLKKDIREIAVSGELFEVRKAFDHARKNTDRGAAYSRCWDLTSKFVIDLMLTNEDFIDDPVTSPCLPSQTRNDVA
jgi:sensor domain CHASE-containing protein